VARQFIATCRELERQARQDGLAPLLRPQGFHPAAKTAKPLEIMKRYSVRFGELLRTRLKPLGLIQRSLTQKLGVKASDVAFLEGERRRLAMKLAARIADTHGLDRQQVLVLAHPEAEALLTAHPS